MTRGTIMIMHRVNTQHLQRLDLAQRARRAEFDHVGRADARQHQKRRQQRTEFAHNDNHHRRTEITGRAVFCQRRNRLPDHEKSQSQRQKEKHRHQRHARAGDFVSDARTDDIFRHAGFCQDDAERDERKRAEPLDRQQEKEEFSPEKIGVGLGQRHAAKHLRVRQLECLCQISAHDSNVKHCRRAGSKMLFPSFAAGLEAFCVKSMSDSGTIRHWASAVYPEKFLAKVMLYIFEMTKPIVHVERKSRFLRTLLPINPCEDVHFGMIDCICIMVLIACFSGLIYTLAT